jgi:hypothetical protein
MFSCARALGGPGLPDIGNLGIVEGGAQAEISHFLPKKVVSCGKERVKLVLPQHHLQSDQHHNLATNGPICMIEHEKWIGRTQLIHFAPEIMFIRQIQA